MTAPAERFRDADERIQDFERRMVVHCPQCDRRAVLTAADDVRRGPRLVCPHCGYSRDWSPNDRLQHGRKPAAGGDPAIVAIAGRDGQMLVRLWLVRPCYGQVLWAFNAEHLAFLKAYVGATLRESRSHGLATRFPSWLSDAHNRRDVLACIAQMEASLR